MPEIDTTNTFLVGLRGDKVVQMLTRPMKREEALRNAAWLTVLAEGIPRRDGDHSFVDILAAVRRT